MKGTCRSCGAAMRRCECAEIDAMHDEIERLRKALADMQERHASVVALLAVMMAE